MMKVTASPTWQWSSRPSSSRTDSRPPVTVNAGPIGLKQTFLPRSLDVAFSLKYRR